MREVQREKERVRENGWKSSIAYATPPFFSAKEPKQTDRHACAHARSRRKLLVARDYVEYTHFQQKWITYLCIFDRLLHSLVHVSFVYLSLMVLFFVLFGRLGTTSTGWLLFLRGRVGVVDAELAHGTDLVEAEPRVDALRVVRVEARQRLDLLARREATATHEATAKAHARTNTTTISNFVGVRGPLGRLEKKTQNALWCCLRVACLWRAVRVRWKLIDQRERCTPTASGFKIMTTKSVLSLARRLWLSDQACTMVTTYARMCGRPGRGGRGFVS